MTCHQFYQRAGLFIHHLGRMPKMIQTARKDTGSKGPRRQMLTKAARSKNVPYWKNKRNKPKRIPIDLPCDSSTSEDSSRSESDSEKKNNEAVAEIVLVTVN